MRLDAADDYHLYEISVDGTGLKQLTFGSGSRDIDPIYLPDGRILFHLHPRAEVLHVQPAHHGQPLHAWKPTGANIQQIGHSTLHEGHASLLPDGRILYDRWEYVDRNFGNAQGLWTTNPDGTNHAIYYGNSTESPGAKLEARAIPGTEKVSARSPPATTALGGHWRFSTGGWAWTAAQPVVRTWPAAADIG